MMRPDIRVGTWRQRTEPNHVKDQHLWLLIPAEFLVLLSLLCWRGTDLTAETLTPPTLAAPSHVLVRKMPLP